MYASVCVCVCPYISPPFVGNSEKCHYVYTLRIPVESSRIEARPVLSWPRLGTNNNNNNDKNNNNSNDTIRTRRAKCVHKTISLCRHYPEEFWFVLVTCRAINHSHAWHISSLALSLSLSLSFSLSQSLIRSCYCLLFSLPLCLICSMLLSCSHSHTAHCQRPSHALLFHVLFRDFFSICSLFIHFCCCSSWLLEYTL